MNRFADGENPASEEIISDWIVLGESVLIRPYNSSGVISFIGPTEFASGTWIGVELDAPTGEFQTPRFNIGELTTSILLRDNRI